jgi:hypothetical protein
MCIFPCNICSRLRCSGDVVYHLLLDLLLYFDILFESYWAKFPRLFQIGFILLMVREDLDILYASLGKILVFLLKTLRASNI